MAIAVGVTLALGVAAVAVALERPYAVTCLKPALADGGGCGESGTPKVKVGFSIAPGQLPRHERVPIALELWGNIASSDGRQPPALREMTVDLDRDLRIDAVGLPACKGGTLAIRGEPWAQVKGCRDSIVGSGHATFQTGFVGMPTVATTSRLVLLYGGTHAGAAVFYAVAALRVPVPATHVTTFQVRRVSRGRYGLRAVAKLPKGAGGNASLRSFSLELKRTFRYKGAWKSVTTARCSDRRHHAEVAAMFHAEAQGVPNPGAETRMKGKTTSPCAPTR